jgi:hypothetical protein
VLLIASEILLVPYIGWGVYLLRRRLSLHDDIAPGTMGFTLAGVAVFFMIEMAVLEVLLRDSLLIYIFATLGLLVSCAALYGHVLASFLSWLLVEFFMPGEVREGDQPRMSPAEALERHGDYEGALEGYRVLARIYPSHAEIAMRVAENLARLGRAGEELPWVQRARRHAAHVDEEFAMVSRACDFYDQHLDDAEAARDLLRDFLSSHPHGEHAERALERLTRVGMAPETTQHGGLTPLADHPLEADGMHETHSRGHKKVTLGLAPIDGALNPDAPAYTEAEVSVPVATEGLTITPLGLGESLTPLEDEEARKPRRINTLRLEGSQETPDLE